MRMQPTKIMVVTFCLLAGLLAACTGNAALTTPSTPVVETPSAVPATPTATPEPPRELSVCIGAEPQSLYINSGTSTAMWSVLESIYDGPIDTVGYENQPVLLEALPSQENGGEKLETVTVQRGQSVQDANGNQVFLDTGTQVLPAGCTQADCAVTWDGKSPLEMSQLTLTYSLLAGVQWSDGQPLTAADSVYAFQVAADPQTPVSKYRTDRTASYQAQDDQTLVWMGIPGYLPADVSSSLWLPLPQHAWSQYSAADLLTADEVNRTPLGWGPYVIKEWVPGDHISLERNPNYFRAGEGLPKFDLLTYRFLGEPVDNNLAGLTNGKCDVVDQTVDWDGQLMNLTDLQDKGSLKLYTALGPEWEHVDFGIGLAAYDGGYSPYGTYRPDIFSDLRVRQAFTYCMDRQGIVDKLLYGYSQVPAGFFPPEHPLYDADLAALAYNPEEGARLLNEVGWVDTDGDPATPRVSQGIANILNGVALTVNYTAANSRLHQMTADLLVESMAACGIQVNVQLSDVGEIYASGPEGPLFGRNFDLAEYSWKTGSSSPCFLYTSQQIPNADNNWLGVNVSGFSNPDYDAACMAALQTDPTQSEAYQTANKAVQQLFAEQLPAVPLYYTLKIAAARPDLCGFNLDSSARSELWNLESLDVSQTCP